MRSHHPTIPLALGALLVLLLGACAAGSGSAGGTSRSADLITREEIGNSNFSSTYELISRLRPTWLRIRPASSFNQPLNTDGTASRELVVYLDNVRVGGVESLESLPAESVETLERIDGLTATQRWGTGHVGGVIAVTTRRG